VWKLAGYKPNRAQIAFHKGTTDALVAGGWRGGKSMLLAGETFPHCVIPSPNEYLIALIGPTYVEPRAEFDYIVEYLSAMLPRQQFDPEKHVSRPRDGRWELRIPAQEVTNPDGSRSKVYFATVRTYTAAEAESIRSFNAEGVVACEAGGISREAFFNIYGRVASTGGFVIGSGTLEASQKWYHDLIKDGQLEAPPTGIKSYIVPSWFNTAVFPGGRNDPKIRRLEKVLPTEMFAVRIGAQPIRMTGIAVQEASKERDVTEEGTSFNELYPVELAIDPGYAGGYAVLAVQFYEGKIRIIDEVYTRLTATPAVIEACQAKDWYPYVIPGLAGVIDRAAKQHNAGYGDSVVEIWADKAGLYLDLTEQVIPVEDGLDQLRIHLAAGRVAINPRCRGLLAEWDLGSFPDGFDGYEPWHYRANTNGQLVGDKALAGADHASTALTYWLVGRFGFITPETVIYGPNKANWLIQALKLDEEDARTTGYGPREGKYVG
jgi:hypothetical protein